MKSKNVLRWLTCIAVAGTMSNVALADGHMSIEERVAKLEAELEATQETVESVEKKQTFQDFEFHGYMRSGLLTNSSGKGGKDFDKWSPFGGYHPVGRLGNEDETYGELVLTKNFYMDNGSWAKFTALMAYEDENKNDWASNSSGGNSDIHLRNSFVEMGNLPTFTGVFEDSVIWAGKRFYGREDIHITDYYVRDFSGTGGGIQNIALGKGSLDLAVIGRDFEDFDSNDIEALTLDARYKIDNWEFELAGHTAKDNDERPGETKVADSGYQGYVSYNLPGYYGLFDAGFSKIYGQAGSGMGAELGRAGGYGGNHEDEKAWSVGTFGQATINSDWDIMTAFTYYAKKDSFADKTTGEKADDFSYFNIVARPVYKINENFELQFEAGYARYENDETNSDGDIWKLTFAPTFKLDTAQFWGRPEIRTFVTYANWNDDYAADTGDKLDDYSGTDGWNFGVQAEVWF